MVSVANHAKNLDGGLKSGLVLEVKVVTFLSATNHLLARINERSFLFAAASDHFATKSEHASL